MIRFPFLLAILFATSPLAPSGLAALSENRGSDQRSITDRSVDWPSAADWSRVLTLADYNTRVVVISTSMLGFAAGIIGAFTLLRKRALMGDALSHATLPGIGIAFLVAPRLGLDGKSLPVLLVGAAASGIVGILSILLVRNLTRLKEDAALGIVLSVFFGIGLAILGVVQQTQTGHAAGLEAFIYGKAASIVVNDAWLIAGSGVISIAVIHFLFKELKLLCFDEGFAGSLGLATLGLDFVLMGLVVLVTIVGLQAVGLVLMIALLVIPAAAARFWTFQLPRMVILSGILGAASCLVGAGLSAIFPRLPSGAMIVLTSACLFLLSMLLGSARGIARRSLTRFTLNNKIDRRHILRAIFEQLELCGQRDRQGNPLPGSLAVSDLLPRRSWSLAKLSRGLRRCGREGLLSFQSDGRIQVSAAGLAEAIRLTREHRLWELYLIQYADIAPGRVDQDADAIEHVLEPDMLIELERVLRLDGQHPGLIASPHPMESDPNPRPPTVATGS